METKKNISFVSKDGIKVNLEIRVKENEDKEQLDWVTLEPSNHKELSISGDCGRGCGQIYDDFEPTAAQKKLVDFWKTYHLNGLCAGTKKQMEALENCESTDYTERCNYLESLGLLDDRGYTYGTGWLSKSFPEAELKAILDEVEAEENARQIKKLEKTPEDLDLYEDSQELLDYVEEKLDETHPDSYIDPFDVMRVIALMRSIDMPLGDIDEISVETGSLILAYGTEYFVDDEDTLEEMAREQLEDDRELWVDCVQAGRTDLGFEDWIDYVLDNDGFESIINAWDGTKDEQEVDGEDLVICRA